MSSTAQPSNRAARDLLFLSTPKLWPQWPYLAVVRRHGKDNDDYDCGLLYDFHNTSGKCGYSATVFLTNFFEAPQTEAEFLALPKEVYDTPEELLAAGWTVD